MDKNVKYFSRLLDGRQYGEEITKEEEELAKNYHIVIVFGYSDDNMEFRGAINSEIGCWEGASVYVGKVDGDIELIENKCSCESCYYFKKLNDQGFEVKAIWDNFDDYSWIYETDIPHETFDILEDDDKYCRGIVFSLDDVKELINEK